MKKNITEALRGNSLPTLFDLPEIWRMNAQRCRYFNVVFFWAYLPAILFMGVWTLLELVEYALGKPNNETRHEKTLE